MIGRGSRQTLTEHQRWVVGFRALLCVAALLAAAPLAAAEETGFPPEGGDGLGPEPKPRAKTKAVASPVSPPKKTATVKPKGSAPKSDRSAAKNDRSGRPVPVFAFEDQVNPPQAAPSPPQGAAASSSGDDDDPHRGETKEIPAATAPDGDDVLLGESGAPADKDAQEGPPAAESAGPARPPEGAAGPEGLQGVLKDGKAPVTRNGRLDPRRGFALGAEAPAEPTPPSEKTGKSAKPAEKKPATKQAAPPAGPGTKQAAPPGGTAPRQGPPAGAGNQAVPAANQAGGQQPGGNQAAPAAGQGNAGAQGAGQQQPGGQQPAGQPGQPGQQTTILPRVDRKGQTVYLSEGKIALLDFLKFLSDYTGLPLLHDSTDQNITTREISIAHEIHDADEDLVKAILEVNRFRVWREILQSGKEVLKVESMTPTAPTNEDPKETQIIDFRTMDQPLEKIGSDEFATMVFELKYTAPRDASEALTNLVGTGAGRAPAAPGAAGGVRGTKSFSMVEVKNTQMLIITAKYGLLNYIKKLLQLIDIPVREPERIIKIIEVEEADPDELVSIINEFLQGQGGGLGGRSGLGRSRLGTGRIGGQPTPAAAPQVPGQVGGIQSQTEYRTNLIPDARTQKIIVETYSRQDLNDIEMLISELDIKFDLKRLRTHIYQVRYLKAIEVATDLQQLLAGSGGGGLSGLRRGAGGVTGAARGGGSRFAARRSTARSGALPTPGLPGAATPGGGGGANAAIPSLIVPHEPTNSLLIQAEPEEFDEIQNILSKIDTKRRQVFLEAALVQVQSQSNLNYTIELIAGNPDDEATRGLFASSFGLTGIDFENFQRTVPDLSDPASVPPGGLAAIMHRGKLPAIIRFFKSNRDSQILATPFVLADDNMENAIEILETRFVVNTATVNTSTTSSQQGEPAGITLALTPTIGPEQAVFLEMELTVSEFQEAATADQQTLPPKNENKMTSSVTIPDGEVFVVGGLTRQNKSKAVSKVPILGDIPIIGKLFRSESTVQNQNNLYVFLQAHILTDEEFLDGRELTEQAEQKMHTFDPSLKPIQFDQPQIQKRVQPVDPNAPRTFNLNRSDDEFYRSRGRRGRGKTSPTSTDDASDGPPSTRVRPAPAAEEAPPVRNQEPVRDGWLLAPAGSGVDADDHYQEEE